MPSEKKWWRPILLFAMHVITASAMFLTFGVAAVSLTLLVQYVEFLHVSHFTMRAVTLVERAIVIADAVVYLVYVVFSACKFIREMK